MKEIQRGQPADDRGHNGREQNRERVHIALVKNSEDHIHDEDCSKQQQGQRLEQLPEHERFALEHPLHSWVMWLELREGVLDILGSIADGDVWQQVEVERDAGELVYMVDCLRTDNFLCC